MKTNTKNIETNLLKRKLWIFKLKPRFQINTHELESRQFKIFFNLLFSSSTPKPRSKTNQNNSKTNTYLEQIHNTLLEETKTNPTILEKPKALS